MRRKKGEAVPDGMEVIVTRSGNEYLVPKRSNYHGVCISQLAQYRDMCLNAEEEKFLSGYAMGIRMAGESGILGKWNISTDNLWKAFPKNLEIFRKQRQQKGVAQ